MSTYVPLVSQNCISSRYILTLDVGCDDSCTACIGSSTTCTQCPQGLFASNGQCTPACPYRTSGTNGTCLPCSPTCGTCSTPLDAGSCTTCPPERPVLHNNRCLDHCPKAMWFDGTTCQRCDPACASCMSSSTGCTSCADDHVLKSGKCQAVDCDFANGLGLCMSDLVSPNGIRWLPLIIIPVLLLLLLGIGLWVYRRRQQRKRLAEVKQFGDAMDQLKAKKGDTVPIRLERILGLNRLRVQSEAEGRYKLKEFLLPQSMKDKGKNKDTGPRDHDVSAIGTTLNVNKADKPKIEENDTSTRYSIPPPPYTRPHRESTSTINTIDLPKRGETRSIPSSKITSMSSASPSTSTFPTISIPGSRLESYPVLSARSSTGLKPPPRHKAPADEMNERPTIRYSTAAGKDDSHLNDLWPARKIEGWI